MKILMLTCNASLMDGINRHILMIAPYLNRMKDVTVEVCTTFPCGELSDALEAEGVKTYSLNAKNGHSLLILPRFLSVLRASKPDVIHGHVVSFMVQVVLKLTRYHCRYIYTNHGIADANRAKTIVSRISNLFKLPINAVCHVSKGVMTYAFVKECANYVVYNPMDFDTGKQSHGLLHQRLGLNAQVPIIGTACRVAMVKDPHAFTRIMCEVLRTVPQAHAVVMGEGAIKLMSELNEIVQQARVTERFHFLGYCKDAPLYIGDLSCFIMTSHREGMPTALLEAISMKTPIAFFEAEGGFQDLALLYKTEGAYGIMIKNRNEDEMSLAISGLLHDKALQDSYTARAYDIGKRYFSVDAACKRLVAIYEGRINE